MISLQHARESGESDTEHLEEGKLDWSPKDRFR